MVCPSNKDIDAEVEALQAVRSRLPEKTFMGSSIFDAIDEQIRVLRERMTVQEVLTAYSNYDGYVGESMLEAAEWLVGGDAMRPTVVWQNEVRYYASLAS